jgi:DNA-binding IscR family transcriptional regulator
MKVSEEKRKKISEHILAFLYSNTPKPLFTSFIAKEAARDEEFVKKLLLEMKTKNLVVEIKRNPKGKPYLRRSRWKLSDVVYQAYNNKQAP